MKTILTILAFAAGLAAQQVLPCSASSPFPPPFPIQNDTTTGTSLYKTADLTSTGVAIISPHTNNDGMVGVVVAGNGTAGTACVAYQGPSPIYVDGSTTVNHWLVRSSTTDGEGHDSGTACTADPPNSEVLGCVQVASTGANSLSTVTLKGGFLRPPAGSSPLHTIPFVIDGGGSAIATGALKDHPTADFACTINRIDIAADQSGSITVEVDKHAAGIPNTTTDKISASAPLTLSAAQLAQNGSISGWTTAVSVGDVFGFNVATAATVTHVVGQIWCQ